MLFIFNNYKQILDCDFNTIVSSHSNFTGKIIKSKKKNSRLGSKIPTLKTYLDIIIDIILYHICI